MYVEKEFKMAVQYQIRKNGKKESLLKFEEWDGVKVEDKGLATARSKMKQEKEAQSRFLISFSFFYCPCWIGPDDEFSLICFRPISEKTHTTLLPPSSHSAVYRKRPPKTCPTKWNEPPELLATITVPTIRGSPTRATFEWAATFFISNERFRHETLRGGHSISISRTCILARPIIAFQRLFHLMKSSFTAEEKLKCRENKNCYYKRI